MNIQTTSEHNKMFLLAKALEQADDMVLITDANGIIEYVNDSVTHKSGYAKSELIGNKTNIFKSGKHTDAFYKNLWDTVLAGKNYRNVIIDKTKDGKLYYADLKITPLLDENKKVQNFVATSTDITKRIELEQQLKKLATIDGLTEIYNRYKIDMSIDVQISRYKRCKEPFSLLMLDIDHFKNINDTHGHNVGDKVLKRLCRLISNNIRKTDKIGRWGGEEFIIILENTKEEEAFLIAEKFRKMVCEHKLEDKYSITVSIGVAQYEELESKEDLIKKVDEALYRAKEKGRNQVSG